MAKKRANNLKEVYIPENAFEEREHPLKEYEDDMKRVNTWTFTKSMEPEKSRDREFFRGIVMVGGIHETKATGSRGIMCILTVMDLNGQMQLALSEREYPKYRNSLKLEKIMYITGTYVVKDNMFFIAPENMEEYPKDIYGEGIDATSVSERISAKVAKRNQEAEANQRVIKMGESIDGNLGDEFLKEMIRRVNGQFNYEMQTLEDKIDTNLKGYMNAFEIKDFMWILLTAGFGDFYRAKAVEFGNITKDEFEALSKAIVHLREYTDLRLQRTDQKTKDRIEKKAFSGGEVKYFDKPTLDRLRAVSEDVLSDVLLSRQEFEEYSEMLIQHHCKNCTLDHNECGLNTILADSLVPESGHQHDNCPYAFGTGRQVNYNAYVRALREIRRERISAGASMRSEALAPEFMMDAAAINHAIEILIDKKNEEGNSHE